MDERRKEKSRHPVLYPFVLSQSRVLRPQSWWAYEVALVCHFSQYASLRNIRLSQILLRLVPFWCSQRPAELYQSSQLRLDSRWNNYLPDPRNTLIFFKYTWIRNQRTQWQEVWPAVVTEVQESSENIDHHAKRRRSEPPGGLGRIESR